MRSSIKVVPVVAVLILWYSIRGTSTAATLVTKQRGLKLKPKTINS